MKNQSELVRALNRELAIKEKELADQKWVFEQILQSPTWRLTAPVRAVVNRLRALKSGSSGAAATSTPTPIEPTDDALGSSELPLEKDFKDLFTTLHRAALDSFLSSGATLELPSCDTPAISIVLVLFNRAELTFDCLQSIAAERDTTLEVVIVDNASTDQTSELLARLRGARIIRNAENLHFLLAANQAAAACRGQYLLLLNNDARLLPGALRNALTTIQSANNIGAVGAKILLLDGSLQEAGSVVWRAGSCSGYGRGDNPLSPMYNFRRDVDYCSGAFLLTPRETWNRLGGFDEAFKPAYYEETDYCMRLWENGLRVVYEPAAAVLHYEFGSSDSRASATGLQAAHQELFAERHRAVLASRALPSPDALLQARSRDTLRRVLFFDDRAPHEWLGSGFPRARALLQALLADECFVTLYPLAVIHEAWDQVYADLPRELEVMTGWGLPLLESFLRNRAGYYSTIIVSRPHNMQHLEPLHRKHPEWFAGTRLVYDAEALFTSRDIGLRQLGGNPMSPEEIRVAYAGEAALTTSSSLVIAVSEGDRKTFQDHGVPNVEVLGHSLEPKPSPAGFDNRRGLLFVGAVHDENSPNADSLVWFLTEIFPRIQAAMPGIHLTIAGIQRSERIRKLAARDVTITGHVASLESLYDAARVFVAPTRYAAGIPHKIHEAAANGLPVVCTPLLAGQLAWGNSELAIAGDAEGFAAACVDVATNAIRWANQRDAALKKIREECSPEAFTRQVARILRL